MVLYCRIRIIAGVVIFLLMLIAYRTFRNCCCKPFSSCRKPSSDSAMPSDDRNSIVYSEETSEPDCRMGRVYRPVYVINSERTCDIEMGGKHIVEAHIEMSLQSGVESVTECLESSGENIDMCSGAGGSASESEMPPVLNSKPLVIGGFKTGRLSARRSAHFRQPPPPPPPKRLKEDDNSFVFTSYQSGERDQSLASSVPVSFVSPGGRKVVCCAYSSRSSVADEEDMYGGGESGVLCRTCSSVSVAMDDVYRSASPTIVMSKTT